MLAKLKAIWGDPVWSKVIGGVLLAIGGAVCSYLAGWWPAVRNAVAMSYSWLLASTGVANWLIAGSAALIGLLSGSLIVAVWKATAPTRAARRYTMDTINGVRWRWKENKVGVFDLKSFCPTCDLQLEPGVQGYGAAPTFVYRCESCNVLLQETSLHPLDFARQAERVIEKKLRALRAPALR